MLAFAWRWHDAGHSGHALAERLANSLCAGIGGEAGTAEIGGLHFAFRPLRAARGLSRAWRPAVLPSGRIAAFHGYFDNIREIGAQLGIALDDPARLYGLAVDRWGDQADSRVIGEYCAIIADPDSRCLRLSRSPLRAPPLCYHHSREIAAAASVPRALFAAGIERQLNERRVADSAMINFADREATWFEHVARVPLGSVVELRPGEARVLRRTYDLWSLPDVRMASDADYLARASELLDEGVKACLAGFERPGVTLSSGLDSPQVAARALRALPPGQKLPSFTFHPEAGYDGRVHERGLGDERPLVEAFAAMHPRLEPYFTANEGYGHDHRWNEFFHLIGGAPSGLCNMYVFHGLFADAAKRGCDLLTLSEWGNYTFSDRGEWGYVEYLLTGKWRQLWLALTRIQSDDRSVLSRFLLRSVLPLFPDRVYHAVKRIVQPNDRPLMDLMRPLSAQYRISSGAEERLRRSGIELDHYQPRNRRHAQKLLFQNEDGESAEIYQGFEQMYGVAQRDPMAYRPFVEFCFGLPVEMFMRDGQMRWLAKQMARGIMPEEQRANRRNGRWDADWHLRIGRRRTEYLSELDRLAQDERLASMLDLPKLRRALEDWPEWTETDPQKYFTLELGVPRGLLAARFINYVEGRNAI